MTPGKNRLKTVIPDGEPPEKYIFGTCFSPMKKCQKNGARKNRVKIVVQTSKTSGINGFSRAQKKGPETPVLKMGVQKGYIKF